MLILLQITGNLCKKQKFDTCQEINLAKSVMYDPTTVIMRAIQDPIEEESSLQDEEIEVAEAPLDNFIVNTLNNRISQGQEQNYTQS